MPIYSCTGIQKLTHMGAIHADPKNYLLIQRG